MIQVQLQPLGTGEDDWPRLRMICEAYAYKAAVALRSGVWICKSKQSLPSGTVIVGGPGVRIKQELTYGAVDPFNAAFSAGPKFDPNPIRAALLFEPAQYSDTIQTAVAFPVGSILRVWRGNHGLLQHYFTVEDIEQLKDGDPYTIKLDRSLGARFKAGDLVESVRSVPENIVIVGNGMQISGTGDRYVELAAARHCRVSGLIADTKHGGLGPKSPAMSFDIGGYCSHFVDCQVESKDLPINSGVIIESGCLCTIKGCQVRHASVCGVGLYDSHLCEIVGCSAYWCHDGAYIGHDGTDEGCTMCEIRDGTYINCDHGVHFGGSRESLIEDVACSDNRIAGIKCSTHEQASRIQAARCYRNQVAPVIVQPDCEVEIDGLICKP